MNQNPLELVQAAQDHLHNVRQWIEDGDRPTMAQKKTYPTVAKVLKLKVRQKYTRLELLHHVLAYVRDHGLSDATGRLAPDEGLAKIAPGCRHLHEISGALRSK